MLLLPVSLLCSLLFTQQPERSFKTYLGLCLCDGLWSALKQNTNSYPWAVKPASSGLWFSDLPHFQHFPPDSVSFYIFRHQLCQAYSYLTVFAQNSSFVLYDHPSPCHRPLHGFLSGHLDHSPCRLSLTTLSNITLST